MKRELKLEYGPRDLQKHGRKERYKGIRMEAKSIRRSKSSHFPHCKDIAVKEHGGLR
jgi:hypothetical protein